MNGHAAWGSTVLGVIVFPDGYNWPTSYVSVLSTLDAGSNQGLTEAQWSLLEQAGAVFLPAGGQRSETSVWNVSTYGYCYSSTEYWQNDAYRLGFNSGTVDATDWNSRNSGRGVRLVCPAE